MFLRNRVQLPSELTRRRRTAAWAKALWCYGGLLGEQQIFHGPTSVRSSFTTTGFTSKKGRPTPKNNLKIRNVSQLSRGSSFHERFSNLYPHQHMVSWVNATDTQTMSLSFIPHSPAWASTYPY